MTRICLCLVVWAGISFAAPRSLAQVQRGSLERPDAYEFAPPLQYERRYEHDPNNTKLILNPDFFCTRCVKEKRISPRTREEMREVLETTVHYPHPLQGATSRRHGQYRLLEQDADTVLDFLFRQMKAENPIFIEDRQFRLFTDLDGFSTRKFFYPRREIELEQLSDLFPRVSEKTVKLNPHHRAHLYLIRAHRVYRDFTHLVEHDPDAEYMNFLGPYLGTRQKFEIYIFPTQRGAGRFMNSFLGHPPTLDGECWHTLKDDSMVAIMHAENIHDVWLNNTFTHRLVYNFADAFRGYTYDLPVWFLLGLGHLMERRERTDFNTFFFGEGRMPTDFWGRSKWKPAIRKLVAGGKTRPLVQIAEFQHPNDLLPHEHGVAWSLVSYQMQMSQKKFGRFLHILKEKKEGESLFNLQVRAFRKVYGTTMIQFFEDWKKWVLQTYPTL